MAEIPAVIVDAQRSGPSTGMPTKTEQSDLNHALYGGHGEAPRVVMAPTSVEDCFAVIVEAFNAAERFQVPGDPAVRPVALATGSRPSARPDLAALEVIDRLRPTGELNGGYKRYEITERRRLADGDPRRPGRLRLDRDRARRGGQPPLRAGAPRGDDGQALPQVRSARAASRRIGFSGPEHADVGIIGWGSTEGAAVEAAELCLDRGLKVATCYPRVLGAAAGRADPRLGRRHGPRSWCPR